MKPIAETNRIRRMEVKGVNVRCKVDQKAFGAEHPIFARVTPPGGISELVRLCVHSKKIPRRLSLGERGSVTERRNPLVAWRSR